MFEFTSDEVTQAVHSAIPDIKMDNIKEYTTFELLRNIDGECNIFDTRVSQLGIYLPPVWLIQQRLWEPLFATMAVYIVTLRSSLGIIFDSRSVIGYLLSSCSINLTS